MSILSEKNKKNILIILSFILISIFSFSLLLYTHFFYGAIDSAFHFKRILEIKESLINGHIFPRVSFNEFHGSAIMSLYPYINLFPIAILSLIVSSKIYIYYIWVILNEFITLIISYYSSYNTNKSRKISYIFSIIYSTSIIFLRYGQGLTDSGIITACAVLPLVFFGSFNLTKSGKYLELSIGITLLIYSHILTSIISIIYVIVWIIFNLKELNKYKWLNVLKCIFIIIFLTSIIWIPFIYYILYSKTYISTPAPALTVKSLIGNSGGALQFLRDLTNRLSSTMNVFALIGLILSIYYYKTLTGPLKKMLYASILFLILCCNIFPWVIMPHFIIKFFELFQNISRFCILPQLIFSYLFSILIFRKLNALNYNKYIIFILIIIVLILQVSDQLNVINQWSSSPILTSKNSKIHFNNHNMNNLQKYKIRNNSKFNYVLNANYYPYHDYYPRDTIPKFISINKNYGNYNSKKVKIYHIGYNEFACKIKEDTNKLVLPIIHYNKEHLRIYKNNHLSDFGTTKNNLISLSNIKKGKYKIRIKYMYNYKLFVLEISLFILGIIFVISSIIKSKMKKRAKNYDKKE